jgi:hypothetical protein
MKKQIMFALAASVMMMSFAKAEGSKVNMNDPGINASIPKDQPKLGGQGCPFAKASPGEFSDSQKVAEKEKTLKAPSSSTNTIQ